jgi:hypothetical protein
MSRLSYIFLVSALWLSVPAAAQQVSVPMPTLRVALEPR